MGQKRGHALAEVNTFHCSHLQNAWSDLHDLWHTSTPFCLYTSINFNLIKFITQSGATRRNSATRILFSMTATGILFQRKIFSRTSPNRFLNKIDSSSLSKVGKIEDVHGLPKQQGTLCVEDLICSEAWQKSRKHEASVNGDDVSNAFCSRMADTYFEMKWKNNVYAVDFS